MLVFAPLEPSAEISFVNKSKAFILAPLEAFVLRFNPIPLVVIVLPLLASRAIESYCKLKFVSAPLDASSGSTITTKGIGLNLRTNASSGAKINAFDLLTNDISADVSSGANTNIHPIVKLKASASSGANIRYNNQPKSISIDESSGGSIEKE